MSILKLRTWLTPGAPAVERLCLSSTPAPYVLYMVILGLPWWFRQKRICLQCGRDLGLIPGLGRSPGGGHGNPLQCSCLENPHGQRAWRVESMGLQRVGRDWAAKHSRQAPLFLLFLGGLRREWASPTLPTHAHTHTYAPFLISSNESTCPGKRNCDPQSLHTRCHPSCLPAFSHNSG